MALTPLDFPASPTVGQLYPDPPVTGQPTYRWDGAQWLSYAAASLPTPTKPANYAKKNYIINGAMMVTQENANTPGTVNDYYPVDQFRSWFSNAGTQTFQQVAGITPAASPRRLRVTATVADASVGAGDWSGVIQYIEGYRVTDLLSGTASAKTITIQFGVKAPAGTYCISLQNNAADRAYIATYVISAGEANTDVIKSVTVTLDTAGTWTYDNTTGLSIFWCLMIGTTYQTTPGVWTSGLFMGSSSQFNFMGTAGNVFELFDVSLTEGSVAPPFQVPDYASELALCKRYWQRYSSVYVPTAAGAYNLVFSPSMRAVPTITGGGAGFSGSGNDSTATIYQTTVNYQVLTLAARL